MTYDLWFLAGKLALVVSVVALTFLCLGIAWGRGYDAGHRDGLYERHMRGGR